MVRPARQDVVGAVELLRQHRPDQKVRPGGGPERQQEVGGSAGQIRQAVGAADDEGDIAALIAPLAKPLGEIDAAQIAPALIQDDARGAVRQARFDPPPFVVGVPALAAVDFDQVGLRADPRQITIDQLRFRLAPGPADGDDGRPRLFGLRKVRRRRRSRRRLQAPHALQLVEGAHFGPEDVSDDIAGVDQHPVALGQALDRRRGR